MTTYIKKEDVQKIIGNRQLQELYRGVLKEINSLPSISFEEMIQEMMEGYEREKSRTTKGSQNYYDLGVYIKGLRLVLDKFTSLHK